MISAAELKARVVVEGVPKGNKELGVFEGTLKRVSGLDATATLRTDIDQSGFTAFEGELRDVSGQKATATLEANLQGRGFDEFAARIDTANLRTSRPITQKVKAEVDDRSFTATMAHVRELKAKVDRESGGGGLTHSAGGIIAPFGALPAAAALASPELIALAGAATAVAGSAAEASLGVGALVGGAYGAGAVGIGGIVAVAVPAVISLKAVAKAQTAYTQAVRQYGKESTEAATAAKKLRIAEAEAGPEAVKLAGSLRHVKGEWEKLSAPGRNEFLGALADGIDHLEGKLPMLAKSANRSTTAMRNDFDLFLDQTTGKGSGFDHFIGSMTDLFVHEGPMVTHTLGDWAKIFENIAEAAGPSLEMVTHQVEHWSDGLEKSSENAPALRKDIEGFVDQTESWVHFLAQGSDLIFAIFGAGAGEGQTLVEDATTKVEDWRESIEADPTGTESFFEETGEEAKELTTILAGLIGTWYQEAKAIEPIADTALHIVDALNSLKIGNVSALTVLLGGGYAIGSAAKLAKTLEILKGYGAITGVLRAEQTEQEAVAAAQGAGIGSADALAAANDRLAASYQGVAAAQSEATTGVSDEAGAIPFLGATAAKQEAATQRAAAMAGGLTEEVPDYYGAAAAAEAPVVAESAGASTLSRLGKASVYGVGGLMVGQVVKEVGDSDLANEVGDAIQGAGVGAAIGSALAPGIGTAIGAAIGGSGGLILGAIDNHKSDIESAGARQAEDFIRGYEKEQPKLKREIEGGFLGHAGHSTMIPGPPGSNIQFESRTGNTGLRGKRNELQAELREATSSNNPKAAAAFEKEIAAIDKAIGGIKKARSTFAETIAEMQGDVALGMGAINSDLTHGLGQADTAWGKGTKPWRDHTAEAMEGAVGAIRTGIHDGTINVEKGQKRISELLTRIHLVKGDDPFGLAEATAKSFEKAGGITGRGVRKWETQLDQMPPAARKSAIDSTDKLLQGWAAGHPKIENQIKSLTAFEVQHFGVTNQQLREGVQKGATGPIAEAFHEAAGGVGGALQNIGVNTDRLLKALGSKDFVSFQAQLNYGGTTLNGKGEGARAAGEAKHHQLATGGIVPGVASGDVHYTHVRPNTFILNKKATAAYGFAEGGHIPVALEPGELHVPPEEVARIGLGNLMAMNDSVPRFAKGGTVQIGGPRATAEIGHAAVAKAVTAVNAYLKGHTPKPKTAGVDLAGLEGNRFAIGAEELRRIGAPAIIRLALFEALIDEAGPISNVLEGEGSGVGAPIMSAAREISGFLTGSPRWTGTSAMSLADSGEQAYEIAQDVQASGAGKASHGRDNYGSHEAEAKQMLRRYGFAEGGLVGAAPRFAAGGSVPPPGKHKDWRWTPRGGAQMGAPRLLLAGGGIADAAHVIEWAQAHLGQGERPGYSPGEWCGDFVGEDMLKHGIEPPADYAGAVNWAGWARPDARPEYGDVVVIGGSGHVGLALGGNKMISGNFSEKVAESTIGEAAGGRPVLGYRTPPYTHASSKNPHETKAEEVAGTFKENVPAVWHGAHTGSLSISTSMPNSMQGINAEIARRSHELEVYTAAAAAAEKADKPAIAHAISTNIGALQKRLRELHDGKQALRRKEQQERRAKRIKVAEEHATTRVGRQLGKLTGLEDKVTDAGHTYQERSQLAEQIVSLEPVQPEAGPEAPLPERPTFPKGTPTATREAGIKAWEQATRDAERARAVATHQGEVDYAEKLRGYIEGEEAPAYRSVLGAENTWRNLTLSAEQKAAGAWQELPRPGGLEGNWERKIENLTGTEASIEAFAAEVDAEGRRVSNDVAQFKAAHPGDPLPEGLKKERDHYADRRKRREGLLEQLPVMQAEVKALETNLGKAREAFYPGGAMVSEPAPPSPGSGSLETTLEEVQGMHWPDQHERLKGLPSTRTKGMFGGAIWATEEAIEELGLRAAAAMNGVSPLGAAEAYGEEGEEVASGPTQAESERMALLEEQLTQARQREAIGAALGPVLSQFEQSYPLPYMGAFADGGVALVGDGGGPELAHFPSGTRIHSADDTRAMLGRGDLQVVVNGHINQAPGDTRDPIEILEKDPRAERWVHRTVGSKQRGVVTTGAPRAFR